MWKFIATGIVFWGFIGLILAGIGETAMQEPEFASVIGDNTFEYTQENMDRFGSYWYILNDTFNKLEQDTFQYGEYGLSDEITIIDVYHSTNEYSTDKYGWNFKEGWGVLGDFYLWIKTKLGYGYEEWEHGSMTSIDEGEKVYMYVEVIYNPDSFDWAMPYNPNASYGRYLVINAWDVYGNEWLSAKDVEFQKQSGGEYREIFRLNCGLMPKTDLYYTVDVVEIDLDSHDWKDYTQSIKVSIADLVERYGGVIRGEVTLEMPLYMSAHELTREKSEPVKGILSALKTIPNGFSTFFKQSNNFIVSILIMTFLITLYLMKVAYAVIIQATSLLPFVNNN